MCALNPTERARLSYKSGRRSWLTRTAVGLSIAAAVVAALYTADALDPLPAIDTDGAVVVVAADGTPLRNYPSRDGVWRYPVSVDTVSPLYLQTLLTYEDRAYYWHPGINPLSLLRAAGQWVGAGRIVSGGSTLTMQVARLVDPDLGGRPSRALSTKLRQMWRAVQLELHFSKDEILGLYLARAPMGGIVEGAEMGSRMWLGKSIAHVSPAEAALLTALPQAPSRLRPDRHPELAQAARDKVIARMVELGQWTEAQAVDARIENVVSPPLRGRFVAPLAAQRLRMTGKRADPARPDVVLSTLDMDAQLTVERMLLDRVDALPPHVSMAALVMDNDTLEIKAYAGSADFGDDSRAAHVDMVRAVRSPGSTLKPFLYGMALEDGLIHSESLLLDVPMSFDGYAPGNFQAAFSGPISVAEALQRSLNVPAVDLLDRVGPARFAGRLMAGGLPQRLPAGAQPNLSLILGGGGTTLEALVGAYRGLARDGLAGTPRLSPHDPMRESRILSGGAAWIVRDILEGGGNPDRPFYAAASSGRRIAWKTGTSFGFRDAWAIGVTDKWTLGVWVGRPDGTPNPGFFGANVAAPLLQDIVAALPEGSLQARVRPDSVSVATVCWPGGQRVVVGQACASPRAAWALNSTVPPAFAGYAEANEAPLRLVGISEGSRLRPVPGLAQVDVSVQAEGGRDTLWWILDGKVVGQTQAGQSYTVSLRQNGRYALTVMDRQGRYDRVSFEIAGVAP